MATASLTVSGREVLVWQASADVSGVGILEASERLRIRAAEFTVLDHAGRHPVSVALSFLESLGIMNEFPSGEVAVYSLLSPCRDCRRGVDDIGVRHPLFAFRVFYG